MKMVFECKVCRGEIIFDVEGANFFDPGAFILAEERLERIFGRLDQTQIETILKTVYEGRGYKEIRFSEKCPTCSAMSIAHVWVPLI